MRNYVEVQMGVFIGDFTNGVWNRNNTKMPGVNSLFFTRPKRFQDVDPEAGCDVNVGFNYRSHNLMIGVVREQCHDATSESVVGRRAELLNGFIQNTTGRPAYNFPSGSRPSNHLGRDNASQFLPRSGSTKADWCALKKLGV